MSWLPWRPDHSAPRPGGPANGRRRFGLIEPHRDARRRHPLFGLADGEVRRKWKIEAASTALAWPVPHAGDQVSQAPRRRPRRSPGSCHGVGDRAGQREVETPFRAVAVHRGQEDFAGAEFGDFAGVGDRVDPGRAASAMGEDLPSPRRRPAWRRPPRRRTGCRTLRGQPRAPVPRRRHGGRQLIADTCRRPASSRLAHVLGRPDAAADRQRHGTRAPAVRAPPRPAWYAAVLRGSR